MLWKRGCVLGLQVCGLGLEGCGLGLGLGGCGRVNITGPWWLWPWPWPWGLWPG